MDVNQIRAGLSGILAFANVLVKFTPTAIDDKAVSVLNALVNTPGVLEEVLAVFNAKGVKL